MARWLAGAQRRPSLLERKDIYLIRSVANRQHAFRILREVLRRKVSYPRRFPPFRTCPCRNSMALAMSCLARPQPLKTTICSRQAYGNVVLIGDAAHSMWASLGQGVQAALGEVNEPLLCAVCSVQCAVRSIPQTKPQSEGWP